MSILIRRFQVYTRDLVGLKLRSWWKYLSDRAIFLLMDRTIQGQNERTVSPEKTNVEARQTKKPYLNPLFQRQIMKHWICLAISCDGNSTKTTLILRDGLQCLQQSLLYDFQVFFYLILPLGGVNVWPSRVNLYFVFTLGFHLNIWILLTQSELWWCLYASPWHLSSSTSNQT